MNYSMACIEDLPNEVLIMIFNKLKTIDVLYSFMGVNKRFDRLVSNMNYTRSIQLIDKDSNDNYCPLSDTLLDEICFYLLPKIHENIECLTLEPLSMERILFACQYPHLHKLNLVNFGHQSTRHYFTDESPFVNLFKRQITHLYISTNNTNLKLGLVDDNENLYTFISSVFTKLTDFSFICDGIWRRYVHLTIENSFSQNIINLCINVDTLDDCLRLLDGRLIYLRKFIVNIYKIVSSTFNMDAKTLSNLQHFSLISSKSTAEYDSCILPLLQRMTCLEELTLCLFVHERSTYIDGFHLKNKILINMPQLRRFNFQIETSIRSFEQTNQKSNDELQNTFIDDRYGQVIYYIDYDPQGGSKSHIFSLPYTMDRTLCLNSNFPGGLLPNVRSLLLVDTHSSFEHQFFMKIAQSFPCLTDLSIFNQEPQQYKRTSQFKENNHRLSTIEFSRLKKLLLFFSHIDYTEQFLVETNTRLPHLVYLTISYEYLQIITENFTRHATRRNCAQLNSIVFHQSIVHSETFYQYFPSFK